LVLRLAPAAGHGWPSSPPEESPSVAGLQVSCRMPGRQSMATTWPKRGRCAADAAAWFVEEHTGAEAPSTVNKGGALPVLRPNDTN
jgi:hypothetical protein